MASFAIVNNHHGVPLPPDKERLLQELAAEIAGVFGTRPFRIIVMPNFSHPGKPYSVVIKFDQGWDRE